MAQVKITGKTQWSISRGGSRRLPSNWWTSTRHSVRSDRKDCILALPGCGGSVNKPFCDGTHSKIGFQGAELAVKKAEGGS